jgi:hypothetical protein
VFGQTALPTEKAPLPEDLAPKQNSPALLPKPNPASDQGQSGADLSLFESEGAGDQPMLLADTPSMFGDFFSAGGNLVGMDPLVAFADIPLAGGAGRLSVADNNKAVTQDRVYSYYNHFHNALVADASQFMVGPDSRSFSVDRYTIGMEKTFLDRRWSAEIRMPFTGTFQFETPNFGAAGGNLGNLGVILKRMVYQSATTGIAAGLGIDTPTGNDATGYMNWVDYRVRNEAVHLIPYVSFVRAPSDRWFYQGFLQVDVPTNGNRVEVNDMIFGPLPAGTMVEQTLLHVDLGTGWWLMRNPEAPVLTGLASVLELHYTTTLQDEHLLTRQSFINRFEFGNLANRMDIVDLTTGIHAELFSNTLLRVGGVFPLSTGDNRTFDAELQVQLERRF